MKVEMIPINSVKSYAKNPRKNQKAIPEVVKSLREFGWRQPLVVDSNMVLVVGHTRLLAAKELGHTKVPVHIASELTEAQSKAYRLMDNRSNEFAEWDKDLLLPELDDLLDADSKFDMDFLGFLNLAESGWETDIEQATKDIDDINETSLGIISTIKIKILQTHAHELKEIIENAVSEQNGAWGTVEIA
jgi:ParB-like chromosome segregation protein Spo0J